MSNHDFSFDYGDILSKMGAAWYISYAYYLHSDPVHSNYKRVNSWPSRTSKYNSNLYLEKYFIGQITTMSPNKLSTNAIGLSGETVLHMARELLKLL